MTIKYAARGSESPSRPGVQGELDNDSYIINTWTNIVSIDIPVALESSVVIKISTRSPYDPTESEGVLWDFTDSYITNHAYNVIMSAARSPQPTSRGKQTACWVLSVGGVNVYES